MNIMNNSLFAGAVLSIGAYEAGIYINKKYKSPILNPLLISIIIVIAVLKVFGISYTAYNETGKYVSYLLTPATVCLAIPLYKQVNLLRDNFAAIISGLVAGVITSVVSVYLISSLFNFKYEQYVTFLPKSVTTAIGMGVASELGGNGTIAAAVIIITGILGNVIGKTVLRLFRITNPVAKGIALGSASHAIGTTKAMELGEVEGAMSSLAIAVAGLLTVVFATVFAKLPLF